MIRLKRLRKWGFRVLLVLFLLVVAALVGIPLLVTGDWGRGLIEKVLSDELGRPVRVAELDFGWLGGFEARDIRLGDGDTPAIRIDRIRAVPDVLTFTTDRIEIGRVEATGVEVTVVLAADGSFALPGWEPRSPPPDDPVIDRAVFDIAVSDASLHVTDENGAELLVLRDVSGDSTHRPGAAVPFTFASVPDGIRVEGISMHREEGVLGGKIELAAVDLERFAPILSLVGGPAGLLGRLEGRISFVAGEEGLEDLQATLWIRDPRIAGANGVGFSGSVEIAGSLTVSEGRIDLIGWQADAPGASVYLSSGSIEGGAARAHVRVTADLVDLSNTLTGISLPAHDGRLEAQAILAGSGGEWTAGFEASFSTASGTPLLDSFPCLGARVTLVGTVTGRDGFGSISLGDGVAFGGGGLRARVSGAIQRPLEPGRRGELDVRLNTVCRPVPKSLLSGPTIFSEGGGSISIGLSGSRLDADVDLAFTEFSVAGPTGDAADVPGLEVTCSGGIDLSTGEVFTDGFELSGEGIRASVEGDLAGLPLRPRGSARVLAAGDLALLSPIFSVDGAPLAGAFVLEIQGERVESVNGFSGSLVLTDYGLGNGLEGENASLRVAFRVPDGTGPVAVESLVVDLPLGKAELSGLVDEEGSFLAKGTLDVDLALIPPDWSPGLPQMAGRASGTVDGSIDSLEARISGDLGVEGLRVGSVFRADAAKVRMAIRVADAIEVRTLELETEREIVTLDGRVGVAGEPAFVGRAGWTGNLASIPPDALPDGMRATGAVQAVAAIDETGAGTLDVRGTGVRVTGAAEGSVLVETCDVAATAAFTWRHGARLPTVSNVEGSLPAGTLTLKGELDLAGPSRADIDIEMDLAALVRGHPALFPGECAASGALVADLVLSGDFGEAGADLFHMLSGTSEVTVQRATWPGYDLSQGRVVLRIEDGTARVSQGEAVVNEGQVNLTGAVDLGGNERRLTIGVMTKGVKLSPRMEPQVRFLVPFFGEAGGISGDLDLDGEMETAIGGNAPSAESPVGSIRISVGKGAVSSSPVLLSILTWLGNEAEGPPLVDFEGVTGTVTVLDGRALTENLVFRIGEVSLELSGYTGWDGSIDYKVGIHLPEGAPERVRWKDHLDRDGAIPIRIVGTIAAPSLRGPDAEDVAGSLLEDLLRRARERREASGGD